MMARSIVFWGLMFVAAASVCMAATVGEPTTAPATGKAAVVALRGEINDMSRDAIFRRFAEARKTGATTIILQINTPGGLVSSALQMSRFLKQQNDLHIIAFVEEKALSAGALISLACNEIVMQPTALLGDCAPISLAPGGGLQSLGETERAKAESPILEDFYSSAIRNGHDPLLVQSMVSLGRVVHYMQNDAGEKRFVDAATYKVLIENGWKPVPGVRDPLDAADTLLTVGTDVAVKIGLASGEAIDAETLARSRGLELVARFEPAAGEKIIEFLGSMTVRGLLTTAFMISLYLAFSTPGHGVPEVAATVALAVLVGVPLLTGYAQWWEVLAVLLGLVLLAVELFMIPGFGVAGISGIVLVLFGLTMTWVGDEPSDLPGILPVLTGSWQSLRQGIVVVLLGMASSLVLWWWLQRFLPKLPYMNRLILTGPQVAAGASGVSMGIEQGWPRARTIGRAVTDLKPGGMAAFADETSGEERVVDVVSDHGYVVAGTRLVVKEIEGTKIVVRAGDER